MTESQVFELAVDRHAVYAFIGYLILLISIGLYSARFSSSGISEFFIGGRKMNKVVIALSAVVSGRSAWLLLGVTGLVYVQGASAIWAVVGYTVVELILFLTYAKKLREFSEEHDCITVPDFFAERFGDKTGTLRSILIITFLIFMVSYVSAQFVAGGKAFSSSFGIEQNTGVLLSAVIILAYTVLGGFLAVSLTDAFQAFFMIFALVFLPFIAIQDLGGWSVMIEQLQFQEAALIDPLALSAGAFIGFLGIGLGSPGNPHILSRYMAIDDAKNLRFAAGIGTFWNIVMAAGAVLIGLVGRAYFSNIEMLPGADSENLYPYLAQLHLHPVLFGIVIASIFAAIMSTADSQLLVAASSVVRDWYQKILKRDEEIPQKKLVLYSRLVVVALVVVALLFGLVAQELVYWLVLFAWAGLGAALGPTSILALYWKGTTKEGVIAGIITGTLVTIVWYFIPVLKSNMYELVPAFIASGLVTILVSKWTKE
ncbi:MAG TPA: sodium/proline symporter [Balneola sp.]|jgi:sodium/proline symporter|nr:sodium:proline symporter [Balneola sp.]MAO77435.1 sodium:proline symporter [Balneola sp.]MBF65393.1 sodium:proline symporter [Balneola sp.]HBZ38224.1 sodium/proline symporter [Balneola sp.]|tara:strand:- start:1021 stop:2472 length:1452 start_codon:yes stop_codon:yes gene_type:complete